MSPRNDEQTVATGRGQGSGTPSIPPGLAWRLAVWQATE